MHSSLNPRLMALIPSVTAGLIDNLRVGAFWTRLNVNFASANANTTISHGLGRKPSGYIVLGRSVAGEIFDDRTQSGWTDKAIVLQASVAGHYDLWIV